MEEIWMQMPQVQILEKEELRLVGFSVSDSLNNIVKSNIVGILREELVNRKNEIPGKKEDDLYLIQLYPEGMWTPDVPYTHIVGFEVSEYGDTPSGMIKHCVPPGNYAEFVHRGPETSIGSTYDLINEWLEKNGHGGPRPFDIELWRNIDTLENDDSAIDIYVPIKASI
ncbi:GyrI-like domain-containing protein [Mesobacillus foraminis]|uniref:GyrI-like domain-containing protein n=1 Tax=Mesobacillus foraminis TaxID=279826 RepID=UPI000EF503BE|nr:effector binding domain-containing protein [Mesobacillus foraminis]